MGDGGGNDADAKSGGGGGGHGQEEQGGGSGDDAAPPANAPKDFSFNVTVNVTVIRADISEATKRAAAISVTLMRGAMPMHAVWAGLTVGGCTD